jgi:uncharacterized membrane protein
MSNESLRLRVKTSVCATVVVLTNVFGNFFMKKGMPAEFAGPLGYLSVLFRPWVAVGVALLIVWMLARMALLSWADLSYVLPVTSVGYVLVALAGRVLLNEQISIQRWAGIALIMGGVALVSLRTAPRTTPGVAPVKSAAAGVGR